MMPARETVMIGLCVNDRNGNHTGRLCKLDVCDGGEELLSLEHVAIHADDPALLPVCHLAGERDPSRPGGRKTLEMVIGERIYAIHGYGTLVGNIFWDAAQVSLDTARRIAQDLLASGDWTVELWTEDFEDIAKGTVPTLEMTSAQLEAAGQQVLPMAMEGLVG